LAHIQLVTQLRKLYPASPAMIESRSKDTDEPIDYAALKEYLDFAVAAYETDKAKLESLLGETFSVLQHNTLIEGPLVPPGHVGHYLAVSEERKLLLVGVRGTSSLEDIITDCCGKAVSVSLDAKESSDRIEVRAARPHTVRVDYHHGDVEVVSGDSECIWIEEQTSRDDEYAVRCHEGIMISAKRLVDNIQRHIVLYCSQQEGYQCLMCGHSLGAGVATLAAAILRARFPSLEKRLRVVAFAPPPVLDHDSAVAAAPFVLSIVNNTDLIPRLSMANMAVFLELMRTISDKLAEKGLQPKDVQSTVAFIRKLTQPLDATTEEDLLMSHAEVETALFQAHQNVQLRDPDNLFVAGRVLLFVDDAIPLDHSRAGDESRNDMIDTVNQGTQCIDTDGCAPQLRQLDIDLVRMVSDHVSASYYSKLEALAEHRVNQSSAWRSLQKCSI
jgi:Lipase (class 3)